jgi:hypothetical protein
MKHFIGYCTIIVCIAGCRHHAHVGTPVTEPNHETDHVVYPDNDVVFDDDIHDNVQKDDDTLLFYIEKYSGQPWLTRDSFADILWNVFQDFYPKTQRPPVVIDIDRSSEEQALLAAAAAGIIPVGRDHRIMPEARIRKQDAAGSFYRIMELADILPEQTFFEAAVRPYDVSTAHMYAREIIGCLALGIMAVEQDNRFHAGRIMKGAEVMNAIDVLNHYIREQKGH